MIFSRPQADWNAAVGRLRSLRVLPTVLDSVQLEEVRADIRETALFSARTLSASYLQENADVFAKILSGELDQASARVALREQADRMQLGALGDEESTITDLRSDARLNLRIRMETERAAAFGRYVSGQDEDILLAYPAQELYRAEKRDFPRDWPARWSAAGGSFPDKRMMARKDSPIWTDISRFGVPYAPFDYNSGMDTRDVGRREALQFGVFKDGDTIAPDKSRSLATDTAQNAQGLSPDLTAALIEDGYVVQDGVLRIRPRSDAANAYNPNQPRIPKGAIGAGRWVSKPLPNFGHKAGLDPNSLGPTFARAREAALADIAAATAGGHSGEAALAILRDRLRVKKPVAAQSVVASINGGTAAQRAEAMAKVQTLLDMLPPRVAKKLPQIHIDLTNAPASKYRGYYLQGAKRLTLNTALGGLSEATVWHELGHWIHHNGPASYFAGVREHHQRRIAGEHLRDDGWDDYRPDKYPDHYMGREYAGRVGLGLEIPAVTIGWLSSDNHGAPRGIRRGIDKNRVALVPIDGMFRSGDHQDTALVALTIFYYGRRRKGGGP